jgi:hypothetical protein
MYHNSQTTFLLLLEEACTKAILALVTWCVFEVEATKPKPHLSLWGFREFNRQSNLSLENFFI